jgi:ribosomal protein S18 acetylase RimI-like enzyme
MVGGPTRVVRQLRLAPMSDDDYDAFFRRTAVEYARDKVRAGQWREDESADLARQSLAELLPHGPATPEHRLFVLIDAATDQRVGTAWLHLQQRADPPRAYLYDIRVEDGVQRQGYGRAAMQALEVEARSAGCASLLLHVFGDNTRARNLYERCGYRVTNVNMRKDLG